jgi:hypothetical protein
MFGILNLLYGLNECGSIPVMGKRFSLLYSVQIVSGAT